MSNAITPHRDPRSDWHAAQDSGHKAINNVVEQATKPLVEATKDGVALGGWKDKIDRLDSKGDTARSRVQLDGELDVNALMFIPGGKGVGAGLQKLGQFLKKEGSDVNLDVVGKAQGTHTIDVARDSNASDSTYTVRYNKMGQGGLGLELTAGLPTEVGDMLSKTGANGAVKGSLFPQGFIRGDAFLGASNTVEMRFNSKEEAQRAAESLEKLAAADVVDDGIQAGIAGLNAASGPIGMVTSLTGIGNSSGLYEGSKNNFANPMSEHGEVNPGVRRAAGVSDDDLKFLGDHVVAQEFSVVGGGRGAVEGRLSGKGELKAADGIKFPGSSVLLKGVEVRAGTSIVPGLQQINMHTRRVEYPTNVSAGHVVDTFSASTLVTAKSRDILTGAVSFDKNSTGVSAQGQLRDDDNYELAMANTTVSYRQDIPAGTHVGAGYLVTTLPDFSKPATVESSVMTPTSSEASALLGTFNPGSLDFRDAPGGQQRVDMNRDYKKYEVSGATGMAMAAALQLPMGVGGFVGSTFSDQRQGDFIDRRSDVVKRDGYNHTDTLRFGLSGIGAIEGSIGRYSGVDDFDTADKTPQPTTDPKVDLTPPCEAPENGPVPMPRVDPRESPVPMPRVEPKEHPVPMPRVEPRDAPIPTPCVEPGNTPGGPTDGTVEQAEATHWQVQPYKGVNVRSSPTTDADNKVAVVQSGSFLDGTGETQTDASGQTWIKVHGRDQEDKMVEGWVRADNLKSYDKRVGDNDATGRVNPQREQRGQDKIIVKQDDNLWNFSRDNNLDFGKLLAANPHLLDPNLIFKGDSVYLPAR